MTPTDPTPQQQTPEVSPAPAAVSPGLTVAAQVAGTLVALAALGAMGWAGFKLTLAFREFLGPKGNVHTESQWLNVFGGLAGELIGGLLVLLIGIWLFQWPNKRNRAKAAAQEPVASGDALAQAAFTPAPVQQRHWHVCNVLDVSPDARHVWQFDARSNHFKLNRDQVARNGEELPVNLVGKSWGALFQKKLNVAWLPPENVFLRVAQFPMSSPEETRSMVELQLEKLSPIPVTQTLWTMQLLPQSASKPGSENLQTIIVIAVARDVVEEFLGNLEEQGYMADRLELPMLDQLQATRITGDGAWVYPETRGNRGRALVAWWYGGGLQTLDLVTLDGGPNQIANIKDQLVQMAWAGELEGWLTSPPRWHLVGDQKDEWLPVLRQALDQPVEVIAPVPAQDLAALTARRAAHGESAANLLPAEFATRYQQEFQDRLWGRGLLAALAIYGVALAIYFVALTVFSTVTDKAENHANELSKDYTNSVQRAGLLGVLKERQDLKFAALDCWDAVAQNMPEGLTLDTMNFNDGKSLSLRGTVPTDQVTAVTDFYDKLRKWKVQGQELFDPNGGELPGTKVAQGGATVDWHFSLDLKRAEK
jgi:hypothetical protein